MSISNNITSHICDIRETTTLILSHYWTPIGVTSAKDAITKLSRTTGKSDYDANIKAISKTGEVLAWDNWIDAGVARYYTNQPFVRTRNNVFPVPTILLTTARWSYRSTTTPSVKYLYKRYKGVCQICGEKKPINVMTLEHIEPKCKHGSDEWNNITMTCLPCNNKKDDIYPYYDYKGDKLKAPARWNHFHTFARHRPEWQMYIFKDKS